MIQYGTIMCVCVCLVTLYEWTIKIKSERSLNEPWEADLNNWNDLQLARLPFFFFFGIGVTRCRRHRLVLFCPSTVTYLLPFLNFWVSFRVRFTRTEKRRRRTKNDRWEKQRRNLAIDQCPSLKTIINLTDLTVSPSSSSASSAFLLSFKCFGSCSKTLTNYISGGGVGGGGGGGGGDPTTI